MFGTDRVNCLRAMDLFIRALRSRVLFFSGSCVFQATCESCG